MKEIPKIKKSMLRDYLRKFLRRQGCLNSFLKNVNNQIDMIAENEDVSNIEFKKYLLKIGFDLVFAQKQDLISSSFVWGSAIYPRVIAGNKIILFMNKRQKRAARFKFWATVADRWNLYKIEYK